MSAVVFVQTMINDVGVFWPIQTVLDSLNEAQLHLYAETRWAITTQTMNLGSGVDIIPIPSGMIIPKWIEGTNLLYNPSVKQRMFPTTQRQLETYLRTWKGDSLGQPLYFALWDATHWRCFPRPDGLGSGPGGTYPMTVFGIGIPNEIADTVTDLIGPFNYTQAVLHYAAALLLELTRPDIADTFIAQANEHVLAFKKRIRNNLSHNIRTLTPGTTRLELQQAGDIAEIPAYYPMET